MFHLLVNLDPANEAVGKCWKMGRHLRKLTSWTPRDVVSPFRWGKGVVGLGLRLSKA